MEKIYSLFRHLLCQFFLFYSVGFCFGQITITSNGSPISSVAINPATSVIVKIINNEGKTWKVIPPYPIINITKTSGTNNDVLTIGYNTLGYTVGEDCIWGDPGIYDKPDTLRIQSSDGIIQKLVINQTNTTYDSQGSLAGVSKKYILLGKDGGTEITSVLFVSSNYEPFNITDKAPWITASVFGNTVENGVDIPTPERPNKDAFDISITVPSYNGLKDRIDTISANTFSSFVNVDLHVPILIVQRGYGEAKIEKENNTLKTAQIPNANYQWYYNPVAAFNLKTVSDYNPIDGATNYFHSPTENGYYQVRIISLKDTSYSEFFKVENIATSIQNNYANSSIKYYPNPVNDILNIEGEFDRIEIYNSMGILMVNVEDTKSIKMASFPNGIYYLKAFKDSKENYFKIIKQ